MCLVCGGTQQVRHEQQTLTAAIAKLDGPGLTVVDPAVPRVLTARPLSDFVLDQHLTPLPNGVPRQAFSRRRSSTKPSEPSSAGATRPSKPSGTSSLRVPTPVSVGTPSACASWPGSMHGSRSSRVVSIRLGIQPVRNEVSRPPLISESNS